MASHQLEGNHWLMGSEFTVADAYLFTVLNWGKPVGIEIDRWPVLKAYQGRVFERPAVRAAMDAEGLLRPA